MKNKAPLALMEQLVMLLVFALAAALCLRMFVLSDLKSLDFEARDYAVLEVQNAAETVKLNYGDLSACVQSYGGELRGDRWVLGYDSQWNREESGDGAYHVVVIPRDAEGFLGMAEVSAQNADGERIFTLTVCWQEAAYE